MATNKDLVALITKKFEERLTAKTGWGRNEIMAAYRECVSEAALETVAKLQETLDFIDN